MNEYIYVMNYNISEIFRYKIPNEDIDIETFLKSKGHNIDECNFMITYKYLDIIDEKTI